MHVSVKKNEKYFHGEFMEKSGAFGSGGFVDLFFKSRFLTASQVLRRETNPSVMCRISARKDRPG